MDYADEIVDQSKNNAFSSFAVLESFSIINDSKVGSSSVVDVDDNSNGNDENENDNNNKTNSATSGTSTLILELEGNMTTTKGKPYHNQYCWIIKTNGNNQIVSITAYLDTLLLERVLSMDER